MNIAGIFHHQQSPSLVTPPGLPSADAGVRIDEPFGDDQVAYHYANVAPYSSSTASGSGGVPDTGQIYVAAGTNFAAAVQQAQQRAVKSAPPEPVQMRGFTNQAQAVLQAADGKYYIAGLTDTTPFGHAANATIDGDGAEVLYGGPAKNVIRFSDAYKAVVGENSWVDLRVKDAAAPAPLPATGPNIA